MSVPKIFREPDDSPRIFERVRTRLKRFSVISEVYSPPEQLSSRNSQSNDDKTFQKLILTSDYDSCAAFIQRRIDGKTSFRRLCLELMSNAARDFGEQWSEDELSFSEVTIALARLHLLLHDFSKNVHTKALPDLRSIVLANAPTEQHAFGLSVVSKVFEFEGWEVSGGPALSADGKLDELVSSNSFNVAGISAATPDNAKALQPKIAHLRRISANPDIAVIVGGGGFTDHPELFREIGADAVAIDADEAVIKARALLIDRSQPLT